MSTYLYLDGNFVATILGRNEDIELRGCGQAKLAVLAGAVRLCGMLVEPNLTDAQEDFLWENFGDYYASIFKTAARYGSFATLDFIERKAGDLAKMDLGRNYAAQSFANAVRADAPFVAIALFNFFGPNVQDSMTAANDLAALRAAANPHQFSTLNVLTPLLCPGEQTYIFNSPEFMSTVKWAINAGLGDPLAVATLKEVEDYCAHCDISHISPEWEKYAPPQFIQKMWELSRNSGPYSTVPPAAPEVVTNWTPVAAGVQYTLSQ